MNQEKGVFSLFQNAFNKSETLSLHFFDAVGLYKATLSKLSFTYIKYKINLN